MAERSRRHVAVAFGVGVIAGVVGAIALRSEPPPAPTPPEASSPPPRREDDSLMAANTRLVSSLQDCNRRLAQVDARPTPSACVCPSALPAVASAPPAPPPAPAASTDRHGPYSRDEWEKFAQQGIVPYRVPCANEATAPPPTGLGENATAVREMYAASNRRVLAQMAPLCANAVGEAAERLGPSGCLKAIIDYARKDNADRLRQTLVRVDEISSGKLAPPAPTTGVDTFEALLLGINSESKALHADLSSRLGPDEAARVYNAGGPCSDRGFVTSTGEWK
jgi:hypothetical protein